MNYEVKSIAPGSVFLNAVRIFLIIGFVVGVIEFFIVRNPAIEVAAWWQRVLAVILFTIVYGLVVSIVLAIIAWLYNIWTGNFKGITFHLEQADQDQP